MAKEDVSIVVALKLDKSGKVLSTTINNVEKSVKKAQKEASKLSKTFSAATKSASLFGKAVKQTSSSIGSLTDSVFSLQTAIVGALGSYVVGTVVEAANRQESAVNSVAVAMARTGELSEEAITGVQNFASELQQLTGIGDETTLEMISLAKSFGATNEQAEELTKAAIELAAATGKSTDEAIAQVSKTLGGFAGELGEVNPAIKELTKEQLQAGEAARILLEQYGGTAAANLNTFAGALTATSGAFGDFLEQIGFLITRNKAVVVFVQTFKGLFEDLGGLIGDSQGDFAGFIKLIVEGLTGGLQLVVNTISFIRPAFTDAIVAALEFAKTATDIGVLATLLDALKFAVLSVAQGFQTLALGAKGIAGIFAFIKGDTEAMSKLNAEVEATAVSLAALQKQKNVPIDVNVENISKKIEEVKGAVGGISTNSQKALNVIGKGLDKLQDNLGKLGKDLVIKPKFDIKNGEKANEDLAENREELELDANEAVADDQKKKDKNRLETLQKGLQAAADFAVRAFDFVADFAVGAVTGRFIQDLEGFVDGLINIPNQLNESLDNLLVAISPESIEKFISGFDKFLVRLPEVLERVFEALPKIFDTFIKAFPKIIDGFVKAFPKLIDAFVDGFPKLIDAILDAIPRVVRAIGKELPRIIKTIGKALERIFEELPAIFESIFDQLPTIIESLADALPGVITAFLEAVPQIVNALIAALPEIVEELAESVGPIIEALVQGLTEGSSEIAAGLVNSLLFEGGLERIAGAILRSLVKGLEGAFNGLIGGLGSSFDTFGDLLTDKLTNIEFDFSEIFNTPEWVDRLINVLSGLDIGQQLTGGDSAASKATTVLTGGLNRIAGFATGGQVPSGFPNDSFPARLTSGELVIPPGDTQRLSRFLDQQQSGGATDALLAQIVGLLQQPMQVSSEATLDGDKFADIILNLNRTNARLT